MIAVYNDFLKEYDMLKKYDGINGYCSVWAYYMFKYFSQRKFNVNIYCLNKGVHYWIEIDNYAIDCRGVFKSRESLLFIFKKFVVSPRVNVITKKDLFCKNKSKFCIIDNICF